MDDNKAIQMKKEIKAVSTLQILRIWKVVLIVALAISAFYVQYLGFAESPVYILFLILIMPLATSHILKDLRRRYQHITVFFSIEETSFILNTMKKKYQYQRLRHISDSITFYFIMIILCLWQLNLNSQKSATLLLLAIPKIMIIGSLAIRFIGGFIIRLKLSYDLSHNKL